MLISEILQTECGFLQKQNGLCYFIGTFSFLDSFPVLDEFEQHWKAKIKNQKRFEQFLAARILSQDVLEDLGIQDQVGRTEEGVPIWPKGLLGSVAHKDNRIFVVSARKSDFVKLGVDCETVFNQEQAQKMAKRILHDEERQSLVGDEKFVEKISLIFSFKEACYKAMPLGWQNKMRFSDVRVGLSKRLEKTGACDIFVVFESQKLSFKGEFLFEEGYVYTMVWM